MASARDGTRGVPAPVAAWPRRRSPDPRRRGTEPRRSPRPPLEATSRGFATGFWPPRETAARRRDAPRRSPPGRDGARRTRGAAGPSARRSPRPPLEATSRGFATGFWPPRETAPAAYPAPVAAWPRRRSPDPRRRGTEPRRSPRPPLEASSRGVRHRNPTAARRQLSRRRVPRTARPAPTRPASPIVVVGVPDTPSVKACRSRGAPSSRALAAGWSAFPPGRLAATA